MNAQGTRFVRFVVTGFVAGLTPLSAFSASQADAESAFAAGKPLQNIPDARHPLTVRDGALVCESATTFANDIDVLAARGDARALESLRRGCVNWHAGRQVQLNDPTTDMGRYALALRFGVLEFTVPPLPESVDGSVAVGFVRMANLLDGQSTGSSTPQFEVQIGPESDADDARKLSEEVTKHGLKPTTKEQGSRYVVRLGPYPARSDAQKVLEQVQLTGLTAEIISPD